MSAAGWSALAAMVSSVGTIVLVIVTWQYVKLTRSLATAQQESVEELRRQHKARTSPRLIAEAAFAPMEDPNWLAVLLTIRNVGEGDAVGVEVHYKVGWLDKRHVVNYLPAKKHVMYQESDTVRGEGAEPHRMWDNAVTADVEVTWRDIEENVSSSSVQVPVLPPG